MLDYQQIDFKGKTVLIREDFNVPMRDGVIQDAERLERALPTLQQTLAAGAGVLLCSHLGRPTEGEFDAACSLQPVARWLSARLQREVRLETNYLDGVKILPGEVVLCENVRFNRGENTNDEMLAQQYAALCDVFVMDAFATSHRAHASTTGVATYAKQAVFGPLMLQELSALGQALDQPQHPLIAIVGGAKVSTKIQLLESLLDKVDVLLVGGGIANTFLKAQGHNIGASLYEAEFVDLAKNLLKTAESKGVRIPLPIDVRVASEFAPDAVARVASLTDIQEGEMILDVGPQTQASYTSLMSEAGTVVWNGPVGVFEFAAFSEGTRALGSAIASSTAFSIAGGGDTVSALSSFNLTDQISYVSTGGGAFLSYLQGDGLPAVDVIRNKETHYA